MTSYWLNKYAVCARVFFADPQRVFSVPVEAQGVSVQDGMVAAPASGGCLWKEDKSMSC